MCSSELLLCFAAWPGPPWKPCTRLDVSAFPKTFLLTPIPFFFTDRSMTRTRVKYVYGGFVEFKLSATLTRIVLQADLAKQHKLEAAMKKVFLLYIYIYIYACSDSNDLRCVQAAEEDADESKFAGMTPTERKRAIVCFFWSPVVFSSHTSI